MSSELWPRDGIHLARVGADIVVLDVPSDAYKCLPDTAAAIVIAPSGSVVVTDGDLAAALQAVGLLQTGRPRSPRITPTTAGRELPADLGRPSPARVALTAARLTGSTLAFQGKTLVQLLASAGQLSTAANPKTDLQAVAAAYREALPWIPREGECLQRAFLLKRLLSQAGIASDWVFGVRTWPFAAHCWIQVDDVVVGDSVERTRHYTPIMAA